MPLTNVKTAEFTAMPNAIERTAMRVKPGFLIIIRAPKRKSCHSVFIDASCGKSVRSPAFRPQASDADPFRDAKPFRLKAGLRKALTREDRRKKKSKSERST